MLLSSSTNRESREKQSDRFIARWTSGDKTCIPNAAGALVTVPYPGLRSFKPEMNQFFFGRERQKSELKAFFANESGPAGDKGHRITFVVGGSGSGKSSLTLAGLIAELNTISTTTTSSGAWYVAETRPERDPIAQLLTSLGKIVAHIIDLAVINFDRGQIAKRLSAIANLLGCSDTKDAEELKKDFVSKQGKRLAPVDPGGRRSIDMPSLFRFVDDTLDKLDAELGSASQRSGKPCLLIHIDQFEEVFRDETDANGREALMQLLRSVHEYEPARLFVVATMRSEELHKCSEFEGIAEVINSSMYLLDLVSQEEIQRAIVEPARRQATLWELPIGSSVAAPYTPEAVRWLQRAYQEAGTAVQHTADQLPLLQHFLPLLWEVAIDDWISRTKTDGQAGFEITKDHIEKIRGWTDDKYRDGEITNLLAKKNPGNPNSEAAIKSAASSIDVNRLGRCLNAHADAVLERAMEKWREAETGLKSKDEPDIKDERNLVPEVGFGDPSPERAALIAAFCCLAQLDDRGRAARRFVTLDEIVAACGLMAWPQNYAPETLKSYLATALGEFESAGFIERIGSTEPFRYNVNHEAFIRNWRRYADWLEEKRFIQQRLCDIDSATVRFSDKKSSSVIDRIFANRKRDAYAIIPDETGNRLRSVFGERPIFSRAWAESALFAGASTQLSKLHVDSAEVATTLAQSFDAINGIWNDAIWWQKNGGKRQAAVGALGLWLLTLLAVVVLVSWFAATQWIENAKLNRQLSNALIGQRAITLLSSFGGAAQYRELYASMRIAFDDVALSLTGEPLRILHGAFFLIDSGVRQLLGNDVSLQSENNLSNPRYARLVGKDRRPADCKITGAGESARGVGGTAKEGVPVRFLPKDNSWIPVTGRTESQQAQVDNRADRGIALLDGALICLSSDAQWLMYWTKAEVSPVLLRVFLEKHDTMWEANFGIQRQIGSSIDTMTLVKDAYPVFKLLTQDPDKNRFLNQVESFNNDGVTGFALPNQAHGKSKLLIWATTGLLDADGPRTDDQLSKNRMLPCDYHAKDAKIGTGSRTVLECTIPIENLGKTSQTLAITYENSKGNCPDETAANTCPSFIELRLQHELSSKEDEVRTRITHNNVPRIKKARIQDGWLWVEDVNGKVWRYIVDKDRIEPLLELKWQGVNWELDDYRPTDFCQQFKDCNEYLTKSDDSWPGPPDRHPGDLR